MTKHSMASATPRCHCNVSFDHRSNSSVSAANQQKASVLDSGVPKPSKADTTTAAAIPQPKITNTLNIREAERWSTSDKLSAVLPSAPGGAVLGISGKSVGVS